MEGRKAYNPAIGVKIVEILKRTKTEHSEVGKDFVYVRCPFPEHDGQRTSLSFWIHKGGRAGKCWRCGHKANWNDYAKAAGIPEIKSLREGEENDEEFSMGYLSMLLDEDTDTETALDGFGLPHGMVPWNQPWRRLELPILRKVSAFRWWDDASGYYRILFPTTMNDVVVGFISGRGEPDKKYEEDPRLPHRHRKYRFSDGYPSNRMFYLYDQVQSTSLIALVEGVYDALRWVQAGIPAICNNGAHSVWNDTKAEQLLALPKLKHVVAAFDPDQAGEKANQMIRDSLRNDLHVVGVRFPKIRKGGKGKVGYADPGDCPNRWLTSFRSDLINDLGWNGKFKLRRINVDPDAI